MTSFLPEEPQNCKSGFCGCEPLSGTPPEPETTQIDVSRRGFLVSSGILAAGLSASPVLTATQQQSYAEALLADNSLRGYWRLDGDLADVKKKAPAKSSGPASFADGVLEGQALRFSPQQNVAIASTNHLRGRSATLEFFFQLEEQPSGEKDVVLLAQTSGAQVRYLIGVKNDLSALLYRNVNGDVVTTVNLPTNQPIEVGRWYHVAVTSFDLDVRVYVDGFECSLVGGAFEFTRRGPKKSAMTLGFTSVSNWGSAKIRLDEVACFAKGLTQAEIQTQLVAAGWKKKIAETGKRVAAVLAERDALRAKKRQTMLNDPSLIEAGESRVYEAEHLDAISFIAGGIGAGSIQFNGKAEAAIWQIACNYQELKVDSFLAVRAQAADGKPVTRALQTAAAGEFTAMPSLSFVGEYPFASYRFSEPELPVNVELEVFSPFIPMDLKNSAIPCVIYNVKLTNDSSSTVRVDLLAAQENGLGYQEGRGGKFGKNVNQILTDGQTTLLHMTRQGDTSADMVLMTNASGASGCADFTSNSSLHKSFAENGVCDGPKKSLVSDPGKTVSGALTAPVELAAGETTTITFSLSWYFKGGRHGSGKKPVKLEGENSYSTGWSHSGQNYTNWWTDARGVAKYVSQNLGELSNRTRLFHDTLYESRLPVWLLDRLTSQIAVLRSQTCWWSADGYFGFWEGSNPAGGCCGGNCGHVWHYAQGHARLLPELGRKIRDQDYATQGKDGKMPNRHSANEVAADGHFGGILNTYREHLCSDDNSWLQGKWPKVKKAMEWGIHHWDPDHDGYMQNTQHNTLDGAFSGCSSWIGTIYLTALEAAARMADTMGDHEAADEYRKIRQSGSKKQNDRLWNGEYYIQEVGPKRDQDYLDGCHIDQLLGEWWADQVGIAPAYPADRSRTAMESLLKYNFLANFAGHSLKPRQYCEIEDGGMKMITWPKNPQPIPGMKYGDEVMTGFEYSAAVMMIQTGLVKEGLMVIKTISDRYDGRLRTKGVTNMKNGPWGYSGNPFGDDECGKFYGRSLSVWSALVSLQGFIYDGPAGRIGFQPRIHAENHQSFFTAAEGYGIFKQVRDGGKLSATIEIREGTLRVSELVLAAAGKNFTGVSVERVNGEAGETISAELEVKGETLHVNLAEAISIAAGQRLQVTVRVWR